MRPLLFCLLVAGVGAGSGHRAFGQTFRSGPAPVPLLELFTSEGCSSCPPAEQWLGELRHDGGLWRDFVPVAWHVNYWDRLGWPDRFATRAYTDRQYAYAAAWGSGSVYTPAFVRAGAEWRRRSRAELGEANDAAAVGELVAIVTDATTLDVSFTPAAAAGDGTDWHVHVALLGGGIVSDVKRGENRGRRLDHEFVVLGTATVALADGRSRLTLPRIAGDLVVPRRAVAVWISRGEAVAPVQATGGWLATQPSG